MILRSPQQVYFFIHITDQLLPGVRLNLEYMIALFFILLKLVETNKAAAENTDRYNVEKPFNITWGITQLIRGSIILLKMRSHVIPYRCNMLCIGDQRLYPRFPVFIYIKEVIRQLHQAAKVVE